MNMEEQETKATQKLFPTLWLIDFGGNPYFRHFDVLAHVMMRGTNNSFYVTLRVRVSGIKSLKGQAA